MDILIPIISLFLLGLTFGLGLAIASKKLAVHEDPWIESITDKLPGVNCGACGFAGCRAFAEALYKGEAELEKCVALNHEDHSAIAGILGIEHSGETKERNIARVLCNGAKDKVKPRYQYNGIKDCKIADVTMGGEKLCSYGCLGYGNCVKVCRFDAIHMDKDGLPRVESAKCTACGNCVAECPRNLIILEDEARPVIVKCSSRDKAAKVKAACAVGCIACCICEKLSNGVFKMEDNISRIDYKVDSSGLNWDTVISKCPTKCIVSEVK